jgi:membrane-associated protein
LGRNPRSAGPDDRRFRFIDPSRSFAHGKAMQIIGKLVYFITHMDTQLPIAINVLGGWIYPVLFIIIFIETGLVFFPFLPGDTLLFTSGAIAAQSSSKLNPWLVFLVTAAASIMGDSNNYWIGHRVGQKVMTGGYHWIKRDRLEKTRRFFDQHGDKTILTARFIPYIRSFAPFVAGIMRMPYTKFLRFNVLGGIAWSGIFIGAGYFFGGILLVQNNFALFILVMIVISSIPTVIELISVRRERKHSQYANE